MAENSKINQQLRSERRAGILHAARELFLKKDIFSTTMKDVSDAAGITRQTLYQYFDNMEAVIDGVREDIRTELFDKTVFEIPEDVPALAVVRGLLKATFGLKNTRSSELLFMNQYDIYFKMYRHNGDSISTYKRMFLLDPIVKSLRRGQQDGSVRVDISAEEMLDTALSIALSVLQHLLITGIQSEAVRVIEAEQLAGATVEMLVGYMRAAENYSIAKSGEQG